MSETLPKNEVMDKTYPSDSGNLAIELLKLYPTFFSTDFEENKAMVLKILVTDSKALRNEVSGHITRLKSREVSGQLVTVPYINTSNENRRRRGRTRRR